MGQISTIPASLPFADTIAKGLIERVSGDPQALSQYKILLPTRRACRIMREAFLRQGQGALMLLPKLEAIGDPDEDELSILSSGESAIAALDIPPAIHPIARLGSLAKLLRGQEGFQGSYEQSLILAKALMKFLDELYIEDKKLDDLKDLVRQEGLADHWQVTLNFLDVLKTQWPQQLMRMGYIEPVDRRNKLLAAQAKIWHETPPPTPIIAAGITGSVPATAQLFKAIMQLTKGEIILPGLDQYLEDAAWEDLEENHPQYSLKNLLSVLGVARSAVSIWADYSTDQNESREMLLSEIMRPATHSAAWGKKMLHKEAVKNLSLIECKNHDEEAATIALIMREVLEDKDKSKTAALITPDRNLALRVKEKLRRWEIDIDDSAGTLLSNTPRGLYLRSIIGVIEQDFSPVALLNLLKQDLCGNGLVDNMRSHVRRLDDMLRGPKPLGGLPQLIKFLQKKDAKTQSNIAAVFTPIFDLFGMIDAHKIQSLEAWITTHISLAENLATAKDKSGQERLWSTESGEALGTLFSALKEQAHRFDAMDIQSYGVLIEQLMRGVTLRPKYGQHPRLTILGQMESRLSHADLIIMGSLNENIWPPAAQADPWMSRLMRQDFGLPSTEQKIGFAAHDFVQLAASQNVIITRAKMIESVPTLPSRWLQRMEAVLKAYDFFLEKRDHYKQWAAALDKPEELSAPAQRPEPRPKASMRFRHISVTGVQNWMVDPYAVYAKYILGLRKMDDLEQEQDHAQKGSLVHDTLFEYVQAHKSDWPITAKQEMLDIFHRLCKDEGIQRPELLPWYPRFLVMLDWFVQHENDWRKTGAYPAALEVKGAYVFQTAQGDFTIEAKADRIDKMSDGSLAIIDYKTSKTLSESKVKKGFLPQLPLEGLIAQKGTFDNLSASVAALQFWKIIGAESESGDVIDINKGKAIDALIEEAEAGLRTLVEVFEQDNTPYYSLPDENNMPLYQDYAHLARVKEWANENDSDSDGGDA
ncbi:MAG: double-strand break repair protein AddB [Micavibrio sp.]|nr:double-strand break repair protein AddB [Micavibrio sp.]|tara:strand:- start:177 stop:3134 length:2958 start_codon:yes stop_codon:yes gene_type:complete